MATRKRPAIHPGEFLAEELAARDMNADDLARAIGVSEYHISAILNGEGAVTPDVAHRLARWIGSSAEYWLNLQQIYDRRGVGQESKG